ncbi:uncharacterized protein LOC135373363 isoform X1 [Ornithodoros turicata]|uniref:uncharacterized protein LOC135373363 isoform X1 n=1 Tax=Ornithodoros turicata TaxID=34597 RepID=UPI0031393060
MSFVESLPAMSTDALKCTVRVQKLHGLHVYYDIPSREVVGEFPANLFAGASVALSFYAYNTPVRFRVAIIRTGGHYVEFGMFENEFKDKFSQKYTNRQGKVAFKTQDKSTSDQNQPVPHYDVAIDVTEPDVHHCMEFRFTAARTTECHEESKNGAAVSSEQRSSNPSPRQESCFCDAVSLFILHDTTMGWNPLDNKPVPCFVHSVDVFIYSKNLIFIGPGGSITITGEFKKSGDTSVTIESKQATTVNPPKTLSKPSGADGEVDLVIFNRGHLLTCLIGGKEIQIAPVFASYDPPAVKVKNFDTNSMEFRTGLSDSKLVT